MYFGPGLAQLKKCIASLMHNSAYIGNCSVSTKLGLTELFHFFERAIVDVDGHPGTGKTLL